MVQISGEWKNEGAFYPYFDVDQSDIYTSFVECFNPHPTGRFDAVRLEIMILCSNWLGGTYSIVSSAEGSFARHSSAFSGLFQAS